MNNSPRILAFAGSARQDSYNKLLVKIAAAGARASGIEVTELDLAELPLPIYDADVERLEGFPANVVRFREILQAHQGFLIASPEYNHFFSPLLKNALDWASRPAAGEKVLQAFAGKPAAIMSASNGQYAGVRGLIALRSLLSVLRLIVLPEVVTIANGAAAFAPNGQLRDESRQQAAMKLGATLADFLAKIS